MSDKDFPAKERLYSEIPYTVTRTVLNQEDVTRLSKYRGNKKTSISFIL
jgi:hypothetical protein